MKNVILNLIIILLISIFILINSQYRTPVNFFGFKIESISIVLIMIVSFLMGIAFILVYFGIMKLLKKKKEKNSAQSSTTNNYADNAVQKSKSFSIFGFGKKKNNRNDKDNKKTISDVNEQSEKFNKNSMDKQNKK